MNFKIRNKTQDLIFRQIHNKQLIYNACWEDPRIDRQLMELNQESKIVMITSAGCNALDYLLDSPAEVHTVDVNFRQNAVLELKLALIEHGDFDTLFQMFGIGSHPDYLNIYRDLRPNMPRYTWEFWDKKIKFFKRDSRRGSFYYRGASGEAAWLISRLLRRREYADLLFEIFDAEDLDKQQALYHEIEPEIWNRLNTRLVRNPVFMALLGVPRPQIQLMVNEYPGGLVGYVKDHLRDVLTKVEIKDNYFWRVYLNGSYTETCCPNYLRAENFDLLRENRRHIRTYTTTMSEFLKRYPGQYTHFVLLDHLDWLAYNDYDSLIEEWQLIFQNSAPGAKVLMRSSGAAELDFLPDFVKARLRFMPERSEPLHKTDRVGTYRSLHFAEIIE